MIYIAHRGFRVSVLENTFQAFYKSLEMDMDYIELDVQLSKDGVPFILHDTTVDRTMNHVGEISSLNSSQIELITSKDGKSKIPNLEIVIKDILLPNISKIRLMIELKGINTAQIVCSVIEKYKISSNVVFSGRNLSELKKAHELIPKIPLCLNITKCKEFSLEDLYNCHSQNELPLPFKFISLKSNNIFDNKFIIQCHLLGLSALSWNFLELGIDPIERIKTLISFGIDGILFDDPETVEILREYQRNVQI